MTEPTPDHIVVACPCGARLRVAATSVGKKAKCPKCGDAFKITAPGEAKPAAPSVKSSAPAKRPAVPAAATAPAPTKPSTAAKAPATQPPSASPLLPKPPKPAKPAKVKREHPGSFVRGLGFSAAGAVIGAVVWTAIAYGTERELRIIAWGVGVLAGIGMAMGAKKKSAEAGGAAAFIAVLGILLAKVLTVCLILQAVSFEPEYYTAVRRAVLLEQHALAISATWTVDPTDEAWKRAITQAAPEIQALSDDEVNAEWQTLRAELEESRNTGIPLPTADHPFAHYAMSADAGDEIDTSGSFGRVFKATLSFYDLLWLFLALSSAFRLASNESGE